MGPRKVRKFVRYGPRASRYGATVCSRPSSFFNLNEVAVPFASRITYVCLVFEGPVRLIPAASSDAPIFTEGRPRSVISRHLPNAFAQA